MFRLYVQGRKGGSSNTTTKLKSLSTPVFISRLDPALWLSSPSHSSQVFKFPVFIFYSFGGLECVGHCFAYVAHFVLMRDVWARIQRATNLATHLLSDYLWIRTVLPKTNLCFFPI
jgi:hypothetical protein